MIVNDAVIIASYIEGKKWEDETIVTKDFK